jgi:two-component system, OmpR family, sensor histidine kinase MprB
MKLSAQVAALTAGLAVATAAVIGSSGYAMTRSGLDSSIDRSIEDVARDIGRDLPAAESACGLNGRGDGPRSRPRRQFREVLVQCIDTGGAIIDSSPVKSLPIGEPDVELAVGVAGQRRSTDVEIDDEHLRVVTVAVPGLGAVQVARSVEERNDLLQRLLAQVAAVTAVAAIGASLAGAWLARRLARPIVSLTDVAEAIDRSGNLDVDVLPPASSGDETKRLTHAFAGMVGSLRASRDAQARLVQDAGHELRTPLTSIRTNVSLLRRPDLPVERRDRILADLDSELRELTDITNELVSLAADGARDEIASTVDLGQMAQACATRWSRRSNRVVRAHIEEGTVSDVVAGATSLQRAVDNLIGNAVKFTPSGTDIDVRVRSIGQQVVLTVEDHGAGIAPADLPRVFERFYRSDEARSVSGSGLGLSIVADVVKAAGGTVVAENKPGGGAVFTVALPRAGD